MSAGSRAWRTRSAVSLMVAGLSLLVVPTSAAGPVNAPKQSSAQPNGALSTEVMVLHATNRPNGAIDPKIGLLPALRQPPFSAYNNYQLVSRTRYPLNKALPATTTLPNGRVLQITLRDIVENRYRVATSINQPGGTTFLPLLEVTTPPGEPFFVAGQSYNDGILVIGITIVR